MLEMLSDQRVHYIRQTRPVVVPPPISTVLLDESGDVADQRILVLGSNDIAETMCALVHTECRHAETCIPGCHTAAGAVDLVLVPHLTRDNVDGIISQAAHSLCRHGRIVIGLTSQGRQLVALGTLMLIGAGFDMPVLHEGDGRRTLSARRGRHPGRA